jgi:hypothetical protein
MEKVPKLKLNSVARVRERTIQTEATDVKLVPTFADRACDVVSVTDPYGHNLSFLDRSRYCFFQVARQLYSRGWVDPVRSHYFSENVVAPWIEPWTSGSVARNSDH